MDEEHLFHQFNEQALPQPTNHEYLAYHNTTPHDDATVVVVDHGLQQQQQLVTDGSAEPPPNNEMLLQAYNVIESEESMLDPHVKPKAVHQCPVCNKIFVSFKGLQQHAIIHTDQKPFECDICRKAFRFKSNLFEHRSVHSGNTPHQCPHCGKTCRLKGNLKKHLRTHFPTKEALDLAWQPFASNRRAPAEIPQDAIIIRANTDPNALYTPMMSRPKKMRKMGGLGIDASVWVDKIKRGEFLPSLSVDEKMRTLSEMVKLVEEGQLDMEGLYLHASAIPFERYSCDMTPCKQIFLSRIECIEHLEAEHPTARKLRPHFCDLCLRTFHDRHQLAMHQEHHKRIQQLLQDDVLKVPEPQIMMPMLEHEAIRDGEEELGGGGEEGDQHPYHDH